MPHKPRAFFVWVAGADLSVKEQARKIDPPSDGKQGADGMGVGLVPTGSLPGASPTHRWCHWVMELGDDDKLANDLAVLSGDGKVKHYNGRDWTSEGVLDDWGLKPHGPEGL